jgi:acetyl-CoA acetyltransferase
VAGQLGLGAVSFTAVSPTGGASAVGSVALTAPAATLAVAARANAARHPGALMRDVLLTQAGHQRSALVADPLRVLDCCLQTDRGRCLPSAERRARVPRRSTQPDECTPGPSCTARLRRRRVSGRPTGLLLA